MIQEKRRLFRIFRSHSLFEDMSGDSRRDVSVSDFLTSASALAVPQIDDSSTEDIFVCEIHKSPSKHIATSEQESPDAPKKSRFIRRPSLFTKVKSLWFSQF